MQGEADHSAKVSETLDLTVFGREREQREMGILCGL